LEVFQRSDFLRAELRPEKKSWNTTIRGSRYPANSIAFSGLAVAGAEVLGRRDRWCGPTAPCRRRLMASYHLEHSTEGLAEDGGMTRFAPWRFRGELNKQSTPK